MLCVACYSFTFEEYASALNEIATPHFVLYGFYYDIRIAEIITS